MSSSMKIIFAARCLIVLVILAAASFAFANPFKSKITGTSSPLVITVPDDHFLKITNFTQEGGVDRGVVIVTLQGETNETATVLAATRIDLITRGRGTEPARDNRSSSSSGSGHGKSQASTRCNAFHNLSKRT